MMTKNHDDQEPIMRTVANENENVNGSTNDPNPKLKGSIKNKVPTKENRVDIPEANPPKFTLRAYLGGNRVEIGHRLCLENR